MLIVCDTLRADHLGCYGSPLPTSPCVDRLAAGGVRFELARSPHIPTQPAHTVLFSGADVFSHGVVSHSGAVQPPEALPWLPEVLRGQGYFTAAVDNLRRWFHRGFDLYAPYELRPGADGAWHKTEAVLDAAANVVPQLAERARQGQPFFAFFHFWDPHTPYCPPAPYDRLFYQGDEKRADDHSLDALWAFSPFSEYFEGWMPGVTDRAFPTAQYAACVRAFDAGLERLWGALQAAGCLEDTLLVFTADHGEELGEHGIWFDHHGLYETNLRVPLILRAPGRMPAGLAVADPVSLLDVVPTVLAACGVTPPSGPGRDLRGAWGAGLRAPAPLYCTECTWQRKRAWIAGRHKLISALEPDFHGGPDLELYDLQEDPGETCNLAVVRAGLAAELLAQMEGHVGRRLADTGAAADPLRVQRVSSRRIGGRPRSTAAAPTVSAEDRERVSKRLENLGY